VLDVSPIDDYDNIQVILKLTPHFYRVPCSANALASQIQRFRASESVGNGGTDIIHRKKF
jgi:hypothetical protein